MRLDAVQQVRQEAQGLVPVFVDDDAFDLHLLLVRKGDVYFRHMSVSFRFRIDSFFSQFKSLAPPVSIARVIAGTAEISDNKKIRGAEMPRLFGDRSLPACCPFCGAEILRPVELEGGQWYDFAGGFCDCGAVFAHDPTARNGGAVLLQALVMAAGGEWEKALDLVPGADYDEGHVSHYNIVTHRVDPHAFGTLYFIRRRAETAPH